MQTAIPAFGTISCTRRLVLAIIALALLLAFGFAQNGFAQAPTPLPLGLNNNYMVTGDYVVGGWNKTGSSMINGTLMSTGTINIPDPGAYATSVALQQVPAGADIVAAFLYWQTVESSGTFAGKSGFFGHINADGSVTNYPITGTSLGNPNAPTSWSSGGCSGSTQGSKTILTYRADVSNLIPVDANGNVQANTSYTVSLPDTGKTSPPDTLGATLVIVYRLLAPTVPLNAVIIYDGAFAPSNTMQTMTLPMRGFYQAGNDQSGPIATKITHIVSNGQSNKLEQVYLNNYDAAGHVLHSTLLPSLYGTNPPFPGHYNLSWDNPTWFPNTYPTIPAADTAVQAGESSETTLVVPNSSNKGCVSWGAVILSTTVQDSDLDGLLNVWKTNQGYCDAGANRGMSNQGTCPLNTSDPSWVALPGAATPGNGNRDVFIQLDYMCTKILNNVDGTTTCDPSGVSYKPDPTAISNLTSAFSSNNHKINVHVLPNDNNAILAQTCTDSTDANGNPVYCPYPGQAGVVGWKAGFSFLKSQPLNYPDETSCVTQTPTGGIAGSGPLCIRRFRPGQHNSYHEAIFGVAVGTSNWNFANGSLTSITVSGNTLTLTTLNPHGLVGAVSNSDTNPNARVTISDAISNPNLSNTYLVQSAPTPTSFTINVASGTTAPTLLTDPNLSVGSGVVGSGSGISDIGGADSLVTLGLWGADGQTVPVESGTFMHELGHSLALTHGGLFRTPVPPVAGAPAGYSLSFEPNCKSNFQSVMNYMFQVDLLDNGSLDYSEQALNALNEVSLPAGVTTTDGSPLAYSTTKWYTPIQPSGIGTAAKRHCDGTPLSPATDPNPTMYRVEGPANPITPAWVVPKSDVNFDGQIENSLQGFNDWANIDLRQIGATGNDFWSGGGLTSKNGGLTSKNGGLTSKNGGLTSKNGGLTSKNGGVGEATTQTVNSFVRNPSNLSATLIATNNLLVSWTPPGFGQSQIAQIAAFNVYRSVNGAAFSQTPYARVPVSGTPPLPNQSFTDTKVSCGNTYSYFVTTVLTDGRESVPSKTVGPISCH